MLLVANELAIKILQSAKDWKKLSKKTKKLLFILPQKTNIELARGASTSRPAVKFRWHDKYWNLIHVRQHQKAQDLIQHPRKFLDGFCHEGPGKWREGTIWPGNLLANLGRCQSREVGESCAARRSPESKTFATPIIWFHSSPQAWVSQWRIN